MAWTLSTIRTKFRTLIGKSSTNDIADADCNVYINDYYQKHFPLDVDVDKTQSDFTQETSATDSGEYTIAEGNIDLEEPIMADDDELTVYYNKKEFFRDYPINSGEDFITAPTLAVGVSNQTAVKNSAFKYRIDDWSYAKASAETALSGSTVPQNKYGAWLLEINSAGTITITGADDNSTGYATAALAVNGLPAGSSSKIIMGFITAMNTAGTFVPGTTLLSAATVTDTYTDGDPALRNAPSTVCVAGGKLFIRPKCDDVYLIRAVLSLGQPTALSTDNDAPLEDAWGLLIALGAAMEHLAEIGDYERVKEINGDNNVPGSYLYVKDMINRKKYLQNQERRSEPSF